MPWMLAFIFPFIHPALAAIGVCAGVIPVLIHLIHRRRHRRVPWAAMSFLLAAMRRSARKVRIEQWLLLAVRTAAIVLFGLAAARPFLSSSPLVSRSASRVQRILLIDNSLSMNARRVNEPSRLDAAMSTARNLLASFPDSDPISVIMLAEPATAVVAHATSDRREIADRLGTIHATQRRCDVPGGVKLALEQLKDTVTAPNNKAVYVISDFPPSHWARDSAGAVSSSPAAEALQRLADSMRNPEETLNLVQVAAASQPNVAITDLRCGGPVIGRRMPTTLQIGVTNLGSATVREVVVHVRRDGEFLRRVTIPRIEPDHAEIATVSCEFPNAGTKLIEARLSTGASSNDLADDDAKFLSVEVREGIRVLLVDGRPGTKLLDGQAGFLAAALDPRAEPVIAERFGQAGSSSRVGETPMATKVIAESDLEGEALSTYDVVALCNVPSLAPRHWAALERYAKQGGGILIFLGDLVNADDYNRYGNAGGEGIIPGRIVRNPTASSRSSSDVGDGRTGGDALTLQPARLIHPIVLEFADHPDSGLFLARFERYLPLQPDSNGEVVLRFSNGAPAMIAKGLGVGRVVSFASTANMDWNNLPAKGDYVSLMWSTIGYLAPHRGEHRNLKVGDSLEEPLSAAESSFPLAVRIAAGTSVPAVVSSRGGFALQFGPLEQAGPTEVTIGSDTRAFAVNVDTVESSLKAMGPKELAAAVDRPVRVSLAQEAMGVAPSAAKSAELGSGLMFAVLALLMVEPWLAMWFARAGKRNSKKEEL